jgi:CheY-like chemotaxis protein
MSDMPKTLLIVDDDISILTFLSQHCSDLGYRVRSVKDGSSALSEIENELPDILLSAIDLPGIPGVQFFSTVRSKFPSIRVVALVASVASVTLTGAYSGGRTPAGIAADAFYEKGSSLHLLAQIVDAMTKPGRSTIRLAAEDLFGFQVFENIPSHPGAERSATSTGRSIALLLPPAARRVKQCQGRRSRLEAIVGRDSGNRP